MTHLYYLVINIALTNFIHNLKRNALTKSLFPLLTEKPILPLKALHLLFIVFHNLTHHTSPAMLSSPDFLVMTLFQKDSLTQTSKPTSLGEPCLIYKKILIAQLSILIWKTNFQPIHQVVVFCPNSSFIQRKFF